MTTDSDNIQAQSAEEMAALAKAAGIDLGPDGVPPEALNTNTNVKGDGLPSDEGADEESTEEAEAGESGGDETEKETKDEEPEVKIPDTADVKAAVDIVAKAGLDFKVLNETYAKDGKLTDADYAALAKVDIPKAMVDSFIAGQIALQAQKAAEVKSAAHGAAGGEKPFSEAVKWASKNMDPKAIDAFNKTIDGGDAALIRLAVSGLMADYRKAGGAEPKNVQTGTKAGSGAYRSMAEVQKDMGDPRYENDPAFRRKVEQKLARSNF